MHFGGVADAQTSLLQSLARSLTHVHACTKESNWNCVLHPTELHWLSNWYNAEENKTHTGANLGEKRTLGNVERCRWLTAGYCPLHANTIQTENWAIFTACESLWFYSVFLSLFFSFGLLNMGFLKGFLVQKAGGILSGIKAKLGCELWRCLLLDGPWVPRPLLTRSMKWKRGQDGTTCYINGIRS